MTSLAVIQARMGSSRFPGKALAMLCGRPVLAHVVERAKASNVGDVIVATECTEEDERIVQWCAENSTWCFRGVNAGCLDTYLRLLDWLEMTAELPDLIVRICGDSPLMSVANINELLARMKGSEADYGTFMSTKHEIHIEGRTGIFPEAFRPESLRRMNITAKDLEHVTPSLRGMGFTQLYALQDFDGPPLTIDTPDDIGRIECILQATR